MDFPRPMRQHQQMIKPIRLIFSFLRSCATVQIWLFENADIRLEGRIVGFDEYMNIVLENAYELSTKKQTRKPLGRIMVKGDNLALIRSTTVDKMVAKLFVANLSSRVHTRDLKEAFGRYGKVLSVVIKEGRDTYAFVEYDDRRDADDALDRLNGKEFYGKRIRVEFSRGHRSDGRKDDKCYVCGQRGHWAKECPEGSGTGVSDGKCFHCGGKGHIARLCKRKRTASPRRSRSPYRDRRSPRRRSSSPRYRSRHSRSRSPRSESASPRRDLSKSPRRSLSRNSDRRSGSAEYKTMDTLSFRRISISRSPQQTTESPFKERIEVIEDTNFKREDI